LAHESVFGARRGDNGSGDGTQFHTKAYLDLIWFVPNATKFLDNAFCDWQEVIERFL